MALNPYNDMDATVADAYARIHGNGEQTHVAIVSAGDGYVAVAYDIDPREFEPVEAEIIAYDPTISGCQTRAERWMEQHPKGILGEEGGGGIWASIADGLKRLNDYGDDLVEEQQQGGQKYE